MQLNIDTKKFDLFIFLLEPGSRTPVLQKLLVYDLTCFFHCSILYQIYTVSEVAIVIDSIFCLPIVSSNIFDATHPIAT